MSQKKSSQPSSSVKKSSTKQTIAQNKKAYFDYFLEEKFESGVVLLGWEVKSLRSGKANITESHVIFRSNELFLLGSQILPLISTSTHITADPTRTRKLLLSRKEISNIRGKMERSGYTCVPCKIYWKGALIKCEIALAKGKKQHDKRATIKEREWNIQKQRLMKVR